MTAIKFQLTGNAKNIRDNNILRNILCGIVVIYCWVIMPIIINIGVIIPSKPILLNYILGASGMFYLLIMKIKVKDGK